MEDRKEARPQLFMGQYDIDEVTAGLLEREMLVWHPRVDLSTIRTWDNKTG
jgi:hypothetical protein